jgi:hypothetical protein
MARVGLNPGTRMGLNEGEGRAAREARLRAERSIFLIGNRAELLGLASCGVLALGALCPCLA